MEIRTTQKQAVEARGQARPNRATRGRPTLWGVGHSAALIRRELVARARAARALVVPGLEHGTGRRVPS